MKIHSQESRLQNQNLIDKDIFMNKDFKVAVVTGASSGIGAEVVKKLASMQFMVVMLARDSKKMDFIADECPEKFRPYKIVTDLKDTESVDLSLIHI